MDRLRTGTARARVGLLWQVNSRHWPSSLPDYKWPRRLLSSGAAAVRLAMAGLFHAAYALGRILSLLDRRRHRVLIIRTDGLGDALLFEPALENLARTLSPRLIHLWAPRPVCKLLQHCPALSRLMAIPRGFKAGNLRYFLSPRWQAKLGFALGLWRFDTVIYPAESPEPLGNWLFCSARAEPHQGPADSGDTATNPTGARQD